MKLRKSSFDVLTVPGDPRLVERPAPGAAPTAFRIWRAGENIADDGSVFFTERSAALLLAEQESRGRAYSIDFDHLSLTSDRPADAGRAAGWHRIEVRPDADGKPELWAVAVEWCADVRAGLEESPPRWRFFSPAFRIDEQGEVTSYVNLALCINPMTHGLPQLAAATATSTRRTTTMKTHAEILDAMIAAAEDGEQKEAMKAARKAAFGDPDEKKDDDGDKKAAEGDDEAPPSSKGEKKESAEDGEKTEEKAHATKIDADLAKENVELRRRIEALEVKNLLDARPDLPETVRKWCATQTADVVRSFLSSAPKLSMHSVKRPTTPTKGDEAGKPVLLEGREREEMDAAMGIRKHAAEPFSRDELGRFVLNTTARPVAQKGK
jgi:phage I-like protein